MRIFDEFLWYSDGAHLGHTLGISFSPKFKARVAMEAISALKTIQEIAADHDIQVSQWKLQLLDGTSELFTRGSKNKDRDTIFPAKPILQGLMALVSNATYCSPSIDALIADSTNYYDVLLDNRVFLSLRDRQ